MTKLSNTDVYAFFTKKQTEWSTGMLIGVSNSKHAAKPTSSPCGTTAQDGEVTQTRVK